MLLVVQDLDGRAVEPQYPQVEGEWGRGEGVNGESCGNGEGRAREEEVQAG